MTLEAEVANLTAQGAALLATINGQKDVLIQRVADATAQADRAAAQAGQVNTGVGAAAGSAAQALAIYGSAAAMQAKLDTAAAQASAAQSAAASAASVLQQDLSAISAALHRSPNAITAMFIYDTSRDSDGGAWVDRMQHTSWANEPLCGTWRGPLASEAAVRAISGAATGDYFQLTTDGKFYKLNAGAGLTEVFRGNKAKFPRLAAIVAEAANVTIYDLTQPGCPMWMRAAGTATPMGNDWYRSRTITSLAALNGAIYFGNGTDGSSGLSFIDIAKDRLGRYASGTLSGVGQVVALRHTATPLNSTLPVIADSAVNAVAMTVLPDASADVATGLQVPTISVFTAGGISVIQDTGAVVNSAATTNFTKGSIDDDGVVGVNAGGVLVSTAKTRNLSAGFPMYAYLPTTSPALMGVPTVMAGSKAMREFGNASGVTLLKENPSTPAKGVSARITGTFNTGHVLSDIRRAYLCNTEVESVSAPELLVDGGFDTDLSGWNNPTDGRSASTWVGGKARVSNTSAGYGYIWRTVPTVIGRQYTVKASAATVGSPRARGIRVGVNEIATQVASTYAAVDSLSVSFTALATTTYISLVIFAPSFGSDEVDFDNVSVKEAVFDRSYKAASAAIYGTLVKSQVAAAAQLVAYSGFSAINYIQEPYSADLDYGVGEWSVGAWISYTTAVASTIADRSAATGPFLRLGTDASGKLVATAYDGTTTRTVTTAAAYNTGVFTKARATYTAAGKLAITVNGTEVALVTGAPLLTLNNANAVLTIGNSRILNAPFPGSITLVKIGATVPTVEQALWMYGQEKQMFRAGAQVTLPAATAVTDLSYDESQDNWTALQVGYESSFTGLIRTSSAVPSAGSFAKVDAKGGVKLLARTTASPGVDVTIPAYGLREELVRRAEAAAKASKTLTVFDFDAIAAQVDFPLPAGWTATEVLSSGNSRREGATKDFILLYDGFRETIRFAVAPGAATWVQINARKE